MKIFSIFAVSILITCSSVFAEEMSIKNEEYENLEYGLFEIYQESISAPESAKYPDTDDMVQVVIELINKDVPIPENMGIVVELIYENLVQAMVPVRNLGAISSDEHVSLVRLPFTPVSDNTTSEGVSKISSDILNSTGFTGRGVRIAVIDTGFDIHNPEISNNIVDSATFTSPNGNHGTAVSEVIVDVAPEVELYLFNTATNYVTFLDGVDELIDLGNIDVVSMSQTWSALGPEDSQRMSEKVDNAMNSGILWVNSAGNFAERHWQGQFIDYDGDGWNNFSGNDESIDINAYPGITFTAELSWWGARSIDFDMCIYENDRMLKCSRNNQPTFKPTESIEYTFTTGTTIQLKIHTYDNPNNVNLKLFTSHELNEYAVPSSSLGMPADARGSFTVGAINLNEQLASYSSQGPTSDNRIKPDIVAPTCVLTSSLGTFCGTSASAPYVAGASALLIQKYPDTTVTQIRELLEATTYDRREKSNDYGTGRLDLSMFVDNDILAVYNHETNCSSKSTSCFFPDTISISPGQTITWINADTENIQITGNGIDSESLSRGQKYTKTIFQNITYRDSNHPWAQGNITVNDPYGISSLAITGPNQATMTLTRPITATISDFGDLQITGESFRRNIIAVDSSSVITITFDGSPVNTDATATFYDVFTPHRIIFATDGQAPTLDTSLVDAVTLEFESSEKITNVVVIINGDVVSATNVNGNKWIASKPITDTLVTFSITFEDESGNSNTIADQSHISIETNSITGVVFHDINLNGVMDAGEDGIDTIVSLLQLSPLSVSTDSFGRYSFTDVSSGIQTVFVDVPTGFIPSPGITSTGTIYHQNVFVDGRTIADFALTTISDSYSTVLVSVVSNDIPVESALVRLESSPPQIGVTDSTGTVKFQNVLNGTYDILAVSQGYHISSQSLTIPSQDIKINLESTNPTGMVSGVVTPNYSTVMINTIPTQITTLDEFGAYSFVDIQPGTYTISVTADNFVSASSTVVITANNTSMVNFDLMPISVDITVIVFDDFNNNGKYDATENLLSGASIVLGKIQRDIKVYAATSNSQGMHTFTNLAPHDYSLYVEHNSKTDFTIYAIDKTQTLYVGL